ncbi:MAG: MgtC/SapB family protein [Deltaproteobacteria bacterium]|nr:MgtC/SapB family protein [Deltaproteobacteria bacterium]
MNLSHLVSIEPFHWQSIGVALLCGIVIGFERQLRGKPVGIRTASLITLGTYLYTAAAISVLSDESDPSRIIGQVVTGVGFLGAGVMLSKDGVVIGVTSAATIWVLAAIGVVIAIATPFTAIKLSIIVIAILHGVELLETYSAALTRGFHSRYRNWRQPPGDDCESNQTTSSDD